MIKNLLNSYKCVNEINNQNFIINRLEEDMNIKIDKNKYQDIMNALNQLKNLTTNEFYIQEHSLNKKENEETIEKIETYLDEYTIFFETKKIIEEEMLKKVMQYIIDNLESIYNGKIEKIEKNKIDFYKNNGYIVEIQFDGKDNTPVVVFYTKKFKEPFSLHLKNESPKITKIVELVRKTNNPTIVHTTNQQGLTKTKKITITKDSLNKVIKATPGFQKELNEEECRLYNMFKYDAYIIKEDIQNKIDYYYNIMNDTSDIDILEKMKKELLELKQTPFLKYINLEIEEDAIELFEQLDIFYDNKDKDILLFQIKDKLEFLSDNPPSMSK